MKKPLIVLLSDLHPEYSLGGGQNIAYEYFELMIKSGLNAEFWYTKPHKEKKETIKQNMKYKYTHHLFQIILDLKLNT